MSSCCAHCWTEPISFCRRSESMRTRCQAWRRTSHSTCRTPPAPPRPRGGPAPGPALGRERRLRFRQPGSRPVVGCGWGGCLPQRFGDALDRPGTPPAVGSNSAQAPTAMTEIRSSATTVEASARRLEPALKVRVGMLIVPSGGPESSGVSFNPRLKALTPAAPADLAAPVARASPEAPMAPTGGAVAAALIWSSLSCRAKASGLSAASLARQPRMRASRRSPTSAPRARGGTGAWRAAGRRLQRVPGERRPPTAAW